MDCLTKFAITLVVKENVARFDITVDFLGVVKICQTMKRHPKDYSDLLLCQSLLADGHQIAY
jgi:hypothetical protein